jgi:hypothetical protein
MKAYLLLFTLFAAQTLFAQGSEELYDLFPKLPKMITNKDLRAVVDPSNAIPEDFYAALNYREIEPIYVIGKLETKKGIILFYADRKEAVSSVEEDLITVNSVAFLKKSAREIPGSSMSYLIMSGDDALYREGDITFNGKEIIFRRQSFKRKGDDPQETTFEVYKLGKKGLEFVSKTTQ